MIAGNAFTLDGVDSHLWVVVSDPTIDANRVVVMNFTSWQHIHDQTCIVQPGEHPWILHCSLVYYPVPRLMTVAQLQRRVRERLITFYDDVSAALLRKIRIGAFQSPFIPIEFQDILCEQFPELSDEALP